MLSWYFLSAVYNTFLSKTCQNRTSKYFFICNFSILILFLFFNCMVCSMEFEACTLFSIRTMHLSMIIHIQMWRNNKRQQNHSFTMCIVHCHTNLFRWLILIYCITFILHLFIFIKFMVWIRFVDLFWCG